MTAPHSSRRWIWMGRIAFVLVVAGLVTYFKIVGLENADKVASVIACVLALAALAAPHLLPALRREGGGQSDTDSTTRQPAGQSFSIDVRNARGVQINQGGQNAQTNNFFESP